MLVHEAHTKIGTFSGGMRQRIAIAQTNANEAIEVEKADADLEDLFLYHNSK